MRHPPITTERTGTELCGVRAESQHATSLNSKRFRIVGETGVEYEPIPLNTNEFPRLPASAFPLAIAGNCSAPPFASVVGEGTFGTVYCGRSRTTGQMVALKRIAIANPSEGIPPLLLREISLLKKLEGMRLADSEISSDADRRKSSINFIPVTLTDNMTAADNDQALNWCLEMQQHQAARRHPNIVQLCDIALINHPAFNVLKDVYLVFALLFLLLLSEFLDCDLHKLIHEQKHRRIEDADCRHIMHQALNGVSFLHENMIMHRDLKPANILVSSDTLHVKIADFGLSRELNYNQPLTETVVTIWYRPPEVLLHSPYTYAVDVWSLGCILFELVERRVLFKARTDLEQLQVITNIVGMPESDKWPESSNMLWSQLKMPSHRASKERTPFSLMLTSYRRETADLLRSMLQLSPGDRISVEDALRSPFFIDSKLKARAAMPLSRVCSDNINRCCAEKRKCTANTSTDVGLGVKRFRSADDQLPVSSSCNRYCLRQNGSSTRTAIIPAEKSDAVGPLSKDADKRDRDRTRRYELRERIGSLRRQISEGNV